jgi:hypothetical protein
MPFAALGQVMLYVDGMNGVMEHNQTVQWLYALIASKFRLVVKTALKLLLVFVEYVEANCLLLIRAVHAVDAAHGKPIILSAGILDLNLLVRGSACNFDTFFMVSYIYITIVQKAHYIIFLFCPLACCQKM